MDPDRFYADTLTIMRCAIKISLVCLLLGTYLVPAHSYTIEYREQLYKLNHRHLYMYPLDIAENIHWLETALRADFANPLNALATIKNPVEWEKYRNLFTMHINLKLVELYLLWGTKYNKFEAYFFNAPFKRQNLESLEKAESLFRYALVYWQEAKNYAKKAAVQRWINLQEIQYWEDEMQRIESAELDYEKIIARHLGNLEEVRAAFKAMDDSTY